MVLVTFNAANAAQDTTKDPSAVSSTSSITSDTTSGAASTAKSPVLQGGVNHAEQLPGLDDALQVGKVYTDDLLMKPESPSGNNWFYIPPWYAGVRHTEDAMIVYRYDYETGKTTTPMLRQLNRQNSTSGFQRDRNGGIWDYINVPSIQHVESDLCNAVLYLKTLTPVSGSDDRIVIKYEEISVSMAKRTNKILLVVQQEQINTVSSPMPGVLRVDVSVKTFGWDGKPKVQEQSVIMANIVKPFEQIDQLNGKDLRPMFRDYLISHHLENLVPADLEQKSP
jgi:hypothetical protein